MTVIEAPIFVDSNVWLYAFIVGQNKRKSSIAQDLLRAQSGELIVSTQVFNEVCVNMLRKGNADEATIKGLLLSFFRRYAVVSPNESTLLTASALRRQYSLSFWDSLIVAAALSAGAKTLLTEDMQDGQVFEDTLTVKNPF